jgi:hypothetical protein
MPFNQHPSHRINSGDLDTARQKLEQANVKFDGETDLVEGMVKTATFYDPDGNALMLAEDLTGGS